MQVWAGRHPRVALAVAQAMKLCRSTLREFHWNWESVSVSFCNVMCAVIFILVLHNPRKKSLILWSLYCKNKLTFFLMILGFWHGVNEIVMFWDFTLHTVLVSSQCFGMPYHSHCQGSSCLAWNPKRAQIIFFYAYSSLLWLLKMVDYNSQCLLS